MIYGDRIAAAAHFEGLYRIVHLRGNTAFLGARPILHFKLDRIDLAWSLSSGRRPYFAQPVKSWACTIAAPYKPLPSHLYRPPRDWDYRLVNVFQDFQNLTLKINRNRLKFVIHDPAIFQNDLTSLQSRLIFLADIAAKPIEQLVRLAMLSMMTTTFRIPGRRVPYNWVVEQLRETYITASSDKTQDKSLLLWVLIKASITVAQTHDAWIRDAWMMVGAGLGWADVRTHLLRVMWIEIAHDELGGMAYRQLEMSKFS
ncbi:hypothetical protein N0V86_002774 [Didymella sp. IMI 355093]|nr:hypothetical protein N0V86_002774 [Didymella sp. IMI 355093]